MYTIKAVELRQKYKTKITNSKTILYCSNYLSVSKYNNNTLLTYYQAFSVTLSFGSSEPHSKSVRAYDHFYPLVLFKVAVLHTNRAKHRSTSTQLGFYLASF